MDVFLAGGIHSHSCPCPLTSALFFKLQPKSHLLLSPCHVGACGLT